jgi:nucleotide-binding universal stress UspA family protein
VTVIELLAECRESRACAHRRNIASHLCRLARGAQQRIESVPGFRRFDRLEEARLRITTESEGGFDSQRYERSDVILSERAAFTENSRLRNVELISLSPSGEKPLEFACMFKRLLVPIDGSTPSQAAVTLAVDLARDQGAQVIFAHAQEVLAQYAAWEGAAELPPDPKEQIETKEILDQAQLAATGAGVDASTAVVHGDVIEAILTLAEVRAVDLIVMGSHGRSGIGRALLGSKAEGVMRRARVPVLIPPHA